MERYIWIYIAIAAFVTGMHVKEEFETIDSFKYLIKCLLLVAIGILIGPALFTYHYLKDSLSKLFTTLQITFFYRFYFTKAFNNLDEKILREKNVLATNHFTSNSIKHRIWRYCVRLINKRNNYDYKPTKDAEAA